MSLNGDKKVKLSAKMIEKLKGFAKKVVEGQTKASYIPGIKFFLNNLNKEEKKENEKDLKVQKSEPEQTDDNTVIVQPENETKEAAKVVTQTEPETVSVAHGKSLKELLERQQKQEEKKKNQVEPTALNIDKEKKNEKPEKKDLSDLTAFDTYEDYKYAYFWNRYINACEDVKVLESFAKDFSKYADINKFRTLLTEAQFNSKRAEQQKAKEIDEINKAHEEAMQQAEEKRQADVQAAIDERQAEVDDLNDKLATARSKNRTLTSKLKVNTEALEQIKEAVAPLGIQKIADIISTADKKCQGIDERAEERAKEKAKEPEEVKEENSNPKSIDEQVNDIMKDINKKVYGDSEEETVEPQEPQVTEEKKKIATDLANVVNQVAQQKAEETENKQASEENSLVSEMDGIFSQEPQADWKTSQAEGNGLDYMGFTPETRAQVGLKAQELKENNNISFDDALSQAAQEFTIQQPSKGKTK